MYLGALSLTVICAVGFLVAAGFAAAGSAPTKGTSASNVDPASYAPAIWATIGWAMLYYTFLFGQSTMHFIVFSDLKDRYNNDKKEDIQSDTSTPLQGAAEDTPLNTSNEKLPEPRKMLSALK